MVCSVRNSRFRLSQGQIFWRETGQGEALVFLHGECSDSSQWLDFLLQLGDGYQCFAPDLLGFGDSEQPEVVHSIQWQSEVLEEFFKTLHLKKMFLIGDSLGAWIACRYALNHPDQVKGLILFSPIGLQVARYTPKFLWEKCLIAEPPILYWLLRMLLSVAIVPGLRQRLEASLQYREELLQSTGTCSLLLERPSAAIRREYLNTQLPRLSMPALISVLGAGKASKLCLRQSQAYAQLLGQSQIASLETEDSTEAIALIEDWLKQHRPTNIS